MTKEAINTPPEPPNPLLAFSTKELRDELLRRKKANDVGLCDVCGNWYDSPTCGSPRHEDASDRWYKRWRWDYGSPYLSGRNESLGGNYLISVSRYGTSVSLFKENHKLAETDLPSSEMTYEDMIAWAVDWAEGII